MLMMARKRADVVGSQSGTMFNVAGPDACDRRVLNIDQFAMFEADRVPDSELVIRRGKLRGEQSREQEQDKRSTQSSPDEICGGSILVLTFPHRC